MGDPCSGFYILIHTFIYFLFALRWLEYVPTSEPQSTSDGHLHLKKGSLPNTLPTLFKGVRTDTLGQQYFCLFGKGWWPLPLPFICRPKSVEKCSQSVAGRMFGHDIGPHDPDPQPKYKRFDDPDPGYSFLYKKTGMITQISVQFNFNAWLFLPNSNFHSLWLK